LVFAGRFRATVTHYLATKGRREKRGAWSMPAASPLATAGGSASIPWMSRGASAWSEGIQIKWNRVGAACVCFAENRMRSFIMGFGRGILLWLLGVPIPVILLLALFWHH